MYQISIANFLRYINAFLQDITYCKTEIECYVIGDSSPYTQNPSDDFINNPIRTLDPDIGIMITLPEEHMIVGIWWQHERQGQSGAYIHNIQDFNWYNERLGKWVDIPFIGYFDGFLWDAAKRGNEKRKEIAYLQNPITTKKIHLSRIQFTAQAWNNWFPKGTSGNQYIDQGSYVPFNLGHDIFVQIELFGCPNYNLTEGKLK